MEIRKDPESTNGLIIESHSYTARMEGAALTSLRATGSGTEFLRVDEEAFPLELYYVHEDALGADKHQRIDVHPLSEWAARVVLIGADSDRELLVRLDPDTGDLCVTPSGQSARRGVASVRWNLAYAPEARLVLPCINGILVERDHAIPGDDRFAWPFRWNAQLAIAERDGQSMMVHSEDTDCQFKALNLRRNPGGASVLGYESEHVGPLWNNRNAGGVEWRINVYQGDWRAPAGRYRDWLRNTYQLERKRAHRPEWLSDIALNIMWAGPDQALLESLGRIFPPEKVLIHLASWRTSQYDVDYPTYIPTDEARAFVERANAMGYRMMPHYNYWGCYNDHPLFARVRDWQIRSAFVNEPQGWYWPPDTHDYTRMGYIHPGLALWRRSLIDAVRQANAELRAPAAFTDQTLCTWNTDNGLVENMNTVQGLRRLQEEFVAIQPDMVLAGEGCNEISFQRECFAQAHIHATTHPGGVITQDHVDMTVGLCAFLWEGHTRLMGYYHLHRNDDDMDFGIELYRRMGAMPTLGQDHFTWSPDANPLDDPRVARVLEMARQS